MRNFLWLSFHVVVVGLSTGAAAGAVLLWYHFLTVLEAWLVPIVGPRWFTPVAWAHNVLGFVAVFVGLFAVVERFDRRR